jgi:hypothetical protein
MFTVICKNWFILTFFLGATLPRLSTKLGKRKPERGNVEDMTVEERLAMLNTTNENAKVNHNFFSFKGDFFG